MVKPCLGAARPPGFSRELQLEPLLFLITPLTPFTPAFPNILQSQGRLKAFNQGVNATKMCGRLAQTHSEEACLHQMSNMFKKYHLKYKMIRVYISIRALSSIILSTFCKGLWIETFIRQCNFLAAKVVPGFEQKASHSCSHARIANPNQHRLKQDRGKQTGN